VTDQWIRTTRQVSDEGIDIDGGEELVGKLITVAWAAKPTCVASADYNGGALPLAVRELVACLVGEALGA
jgi:hypothetical protein